MANKLLTRTAQTLAAIVLVQLAGIAANAASTGATSLYMPQADGAGTANGDYISSIPISGGSYRYFVEVPPAQSHLVVEIFDADFGGGTNEDIAQRDRDRNSFGSVTYTLIRPDGTTAATQTCASGVNAGFCADNAWSALLDSTGDTYRDNFGAAAYTNNDGNRNWATNWTETNDDNNAGAGQVQITGGELRIGDNGGAVSTIEREANLSTFTTATFTFDFRTTGVDAGDQLSVQVSNNGGTSWTNLETFTGPQAASSRSYNISSSIASNTRIRFIEVSGYGNNDFFFVDNLQIKDSVINKGHWEIDVNETAGGTDGINAIGLRAHDGTSGSGGIEFPMYYDSHNQFGQNPPNTGTGTKSYATYPYITSGCSATENDFDYDSNSGTVGSIALSSRTGAFTNNIASASLSANNVWDQNSFTGWSDDLNSIEDGLWTATVNISNYTVNGTVNGNYANIWFGNFNTTGAPTPTANPTTNAFRVYLPNDAIAKPVKTYVEQLARFSGCGVSSGPNPPVVGQTSCYTVTVRVVNPEAQAVTFSSPSNIVTTTVPAGSGVVYSGHSQVSPGTTLLGQPSIGGTGNVTWNPGVVAAGATVELAYTVSVTPTSAGQRVPLTGTPALNGTIAKYVDITGNTTQTRATYTFGPLCELAVTQGLLTEALVSNFRAYEDSGVVAVEWQTASEAGTVGFYLERFDVSRKKFVRVSKDLLPALANSPEGASYRFVDPTASPREPISRYRLIEVRADGQRRRLGPFDVKVDWDNGRSAQLKGDEDFESAKRVTAQRDAPAVEESKVATLATKPVDSLRLGVRETGIQFVSSAALASALGESQSTIESMLSRGGFTLTKQGQPVWWMADPITRKKASAGMYFYGEAIHDLYSPDQAYRLTRGSGPVMPAVTVAGGAGGASDTFVDLKHSEVDAFPATVTPLNPESDYWFWSGLIGGSPTDGTRTFSIDAPGAVATAAATLKLHLQGVSSSGVTNEHHVQASLNGVILGDGQWTGITATDFTFAVPASTLLGGGNQLQLTALLNSGTPYSFTDFDYAELTYARTYSAASDALVFRPDGHAGLSVNGFSSADVRLFDVGDPMHPRSLVGATGTSAGGSFGIGFTPPAPSSTYAAVGPTGPKTPGLRPWIDGQLKASGRGADYVIVTTAALSAAAQRLANVRESQGLRTAVIDVEAVMNEFNSGRSNPHALHDFLAYTRSFWSPAPRYVVFAGAGSLDYRNLLGNGDSLVPTILVSTAGGLFGSDNRVADLIGNDGIPDVAVGRIPVTTAQQLNDYVDKLVAYESDPGGAWAGGVLALADAKDQSADFAADSDQVLSRLPGSYGPVRIYLDNMTLGTARNQLLNGIASGAAFVDYLGHGALDRLSAGGLLSTGDVAAMQNGAKLPVLTAMTCEASRFTVPGIPSLGEQLVNHAGGGAIAAWAPSALSIQSEARTLAEKFYGAVGAGHSPRLGDVVQKALGDFQAAGGSASMFDIYVLLGDPALRLKVAPAAPPATGGQPSIGVE